MNKLLDTRDDVKKFMVAGDQTIIGFSDQSDLYMKLITEELIHEFLKEYEKQNIVGIADGIADSIVVLEGLSHSLGLDLEKIWKYVDEIGSYPHGVEYTVCEILFHYSDLRGYYNLTKSGYEIPGNKKFSEISNNIGNIINHLLYVSRHYNIPIQEIWDEVARSNNSKISENGKVIKNELGKIQKPDTFSPPNIESILKNHGLI